MLKDFRKLVETKEIKWNDTLYLADKDYYQTAIKADLARAIFGRNQYLQVFYSIDKQMNKAIELFPEAKKVANLRTSKNGGRK